MFADIIPGIPDVELGLFIITVLLFIVTAWQAHLTSRNVRAAEDSVSATNQLIELQTEPFVHIEANWEHVPSYGAPFDEYENSLLISIKNRGGGPARDIKIVDVKDDFPILWTEPNLRHKTFKELEV